MAKIECPDCRGDGFLDHGGGEVSTCHRCDGVGKIEVGEPTGACAVCWDPVYAGSAVCSDRCAHTARPTVAPAPEVRS
jgi:hypothetical protein